MLGHWFLYAIVITSLIAAAAAAMDRFVTIWRMPRRVVWTIALCSGMAAPIIAGVREQPRAAPRLSAPIARVETTPIVFDRVSSVAKTAIPRAAARSASSYPLALSAIEPLLPLLWFTASATLGLFLLVALTRLRHQARGWREARVDGIDLLVAPEAGPAVVGFVRPRVVVPEWIVALDAHSRALILSHELEHVRARDPYLLLFAILSTIAAPWNVAIWFLARRLTLAVELDCDQRVLQTTGSVREYGLVLLEVARRRNVGGILLGASLVHPRRFLARRIRSMVTTRGPWPRLTSVAFATAATLLTLAATRLPTPEPLRLHARTMSLESTHLPVPVRMTAETRRPALVVPARPTHRRAGPTPRISANWENAPVETVAAAFARFSGRRIDIAPDVVGSVTARVSDEPWDEALAHVMGANGYGLVVHPDSSFTIVVAPSSPPRLAPPSGNRPLRGRALDASTNLPIVGATIYVVGLQAIGEPNRTCTTEGGTFQLKVPDGEAWLEATAAGYEFSRVTLAAQDTEAVFRGRRTAMLFVRDSVMFYLRNTPILARSVGSPKQVIPLIVINGAVVDGAPTGPQPRCSSA